MVVGLSAPACPAPISSTWTGWYVGVNAGGIWSDGEFSIVPNQVGPPGSGAFTPAAAAAFRNVLNRTERDFDFTGGAQFGYSRQWGPLVVGVEFDFGYIQAGRTFSGVVPPGPGVGGATVTESYRSRWLNTNRLRFGYDSGAVLYYATGGIAVANVEVDSRAVGGPAVVVGSETSTQVGWTAGVGAEWMVAPRWSVKLEYLHADLGTTKVRSTDPNFPPSFIDTSLRLRENIVKAGLNYRH
jgi:outer membrane immunogenic protein